MIYRLNKIGVARIVSIFIITFVSASWILIGCTEKHERVTKPQNEEVKMEVSAGELHNEIVESVIEESSSPLKPGSSEFIELYSRIATEISNNHGILIDEKSVSKMVEEYFSKWHFDLREKSPAEIIDYYAKEGIITSREKEALQNLFENAIADINSQVENEITINWKEHSFLKNNGDVPDIVVAVDDILSHSVAMWEKKYEEEIIHVDNNGRNFVTFWDKVCKTICVGCADGLGYIGGAAIGASVGGPIGAGVGGAIGAGAASYAMDATMDHIEDSIEDES